MVEEDDFIVNTKQEYTKEYRLVISSIVGTQYLIPMNLYTTVT